MHGYGAARIWAATLLAFGALGLRSSESFGPPVTVTGGEATIRIVRNASEQCAKAFDPAHLTVKSGTTVVFENGDWETHTVVSGSGDDPCSFVHDPDGARAIDLGQLYSGLGLRQKFTRPGSYPYMCHMPGHHMAGLITVLP